MSTSDKLDADQRPELTWGKYYKWVDGREPRPLFLNALAKFDGETGNGFKKHAVDLGCGDGTETRALLEAGWTVLAIDNEPLAFEYLAKKVRPEHSSRLQTRLASFEDLYLPETDFVYAGLSLPFCGPSCFERLWAIIREVIRPGGRFAGHIFGDRDTWAGKPEMSFYSHDQVNALLSQAFEIEDLKEVEEDSEALGGTKHWHLFEIIARKPG